MDHAFVLDERVVCRRRNAFSVEELNCGTQSAEGVATIDKRRLRDEQNEEDDETY